MIASEFVDVLDQVADVCPVIQVPEADHQRVLAAVWRLEIRLEGLAGRLAQAVNNTPVPLPPTRPVPPPPPQEPKPKGCVR